MGKVRIVNDGLHAMRARIECADCGAALMATRAEIDLTPGRVVVRLTLLEAAIDVVGVSDEPVCGPCAFPTVDEVLPR
jgi:hypothetical protein